MGADFGPCSPWPVYFTCDVSAYSPAATGQAVQLATDLLWGLSGRQFGTCTVTTRPCREECAGEGPFGGALYPWLPTSSVAQIGWDTSWWFEAGCGSCDFGSCSCNRISQIRLPSPVNQVVQVKVDGSPLVTGAYRLDNNRLLLRTDGQMWPRCNDLNLDDTHSGTWSVTASYGEDVPQSGQVAMGQLTCEILKAMNGQDCQLPANVTQLIRQGVTITMPSIGELLDNHRTGLYLVDLFLQAVNPNKLVQRSRVYSPDRPPVRRAGS